MPAFQYVARDPAGKRIQGLAQADSVNDVLSQLTGKGFIVTKLEPADERKKFSWSDIIHFGTISEEALIFFNLQLSSMLEAGLPLVACLNLLIPQLRNRRFRRVIQGVAAGVEEGKSFSESTSQYPRVFSDLFISLAVAGEASGNLEKMLSRYAHFLEDQLDLKRKVQSAMTYPIILIIVSIAVVVAMVTLVIPQFVAIFEKSGIPLPAPTQFLYILSIVFRKFWWLVMLICILLYVMLFFVGRTKGGKRFFDWCKLHAPLFGSLITRVVISRWVRTLGVLIGGGVPILQALGISKTMPGNVVVEARIENAAVHVEKGGRLADAFRNDQVFPLEVVQMINVGEESGTLDSMLLKIADFYDKMIGYQVKRLSDLVEPLFLIVIGGIVAFIMISVMLPIFDMIQLVQGGRF
jgi:type IV pilus assembly protein PilC